MSCDVREATEGLENELWRRWSDGKVGESAHSPNFPSLLLRLSSFSNPSVALPTWKLILQPFRCFTYVTAHSPTLLSLFLHHRALHLRHLASRPWLTSVSNIQDRDCEEFWGTIFECKDWVIRKKMKMIISLLNDVELIFLETLPCILYCRK